MSGALQSVWLALVAVSLMSTAASGAGLALPRDGWVSWQVAAADGARAACCFEQTGSPATVCKLDGPPQGMTLREYTQMASLRLYARFAGGALQQLQAYGAGCAVTAATPIKDLGVQDTSTSLEWLDRQIEPRNAHSDDALAALALHQGKAPAARLAQLARSSANADSRSGAMFWLCQTAAAESEAVIRAVLTGERSEEVRHQAIFALSQLPPARSFDALTAVLEDRRLKLDDRKQALFWLGQSPDARVTAYLAKVLGV